jgi:DNA-binding XRE family transcriptional regulator
MQMGQTNLLLKTSRLNRGMTIREMAAAIGIAHGTYERAERGDGLHPSTAKKIADHFHVKVSDLFPIEDVERAA